MSGRAVILFAHGARDPRWAQPLEALAERVLAARPGTWVSPAYLEFMNPTLPEAIDAAVVAGAGQISVVPVFLAAGGHVKRDLPAMLEAARQRHPGLQLTLTPVLGETDAVLAAMTQQVLADSD